jgi:flagellar hook-associated protein 1
VANLLTSLNTAAQSMSTYEKAMEVVQNDTVNSNTPGYVRQSVSFQALPLSINGAAAGGVAIGNVVSSRDEYAERNVQMQQTAYTSSSTLASHLSQLQPIFDLQSTTGVAGSLDSLFSSFSQLAVSPNDAQYRASVISAAGGVATAFNVASSALSSARTNVDNDIQSTLTNINNTLADIANINVQLRSQSQTTPDPSIDARLHIDLETLSQYAGITSVTAQDGSISVYLSGQRPLLIGANVNKLSATTNSSGVTIQDSNGIDVTATVSGGQLGALLQVRNTVLPGYKSRLDTLAQNIADQINQQLSLGVDQGMPPATGAALFTYSASNPSQTLAVTSITTTEIAAASSSNPGGNDNALTLSKLQSNTIAGLGNFTFTQYYGDLSSQVGRDVSNAESDQTTQQSLLAQAQTLRSQSSSVSLDEEAARLLQYQQSYAATTKLITVIDQMTSALMSIIPAQ